MESKTGRGHKDAPNSRNRNHMAEVLAANDLECDDMGSIIWCSGSGAACAMDRIISRKEKVVGKIP